MIKIAILTHNMHQIQGANRVTEKLIFGRNEFEKNGIRLMTIFSSDGILRPELYNSNMLGTRDKRKISGVQRKLINALKRIPLYSSYIGNVWSIKKNLKPDMKAAYLAANHIDNYDCILAQGFQSGYYFLKLKKRLGLNTKLIIVLHTDRDPLEQLLLEKPRVKGTIYEKKLRSMLEYTLRNADRIITVCKPEMIYLKDNYSLDSSYITNGIEDYIQKSDKLSKLNRKLNIVIVASVQYRKGQDILVDAINALEKRYRDNVLVHVVGDGQDFDKIKASIKNKNLEEQFVLYGLVKDIRELLSRMDIFILPTRADTTPISIVEAMRAALPIFASNVGEIPSMIEGAGMLIYPSVESVKSTIENCVDNKFDLKLMSAKSRENYESRYKLSVMIDKYSRVIHEVCDK